MAELPKPLVEYFAANETFDVDGMLGAFAEDATIIDEKQTYRGHAEIRPWIEKATVETQAIAVPGEVNEDGSDIKFLAEVRGQFPTSPVTLHFRCRVADDRIVFLEIVE